MSNKLFIIKSDSGELRYYSNFQKAHDDLEYNYYRHMDCKKVNLRMEEYTLDSINGQYKSSNITYTYNFDGLKDWMNLESFGPHLFIKKM